jgi:DNA-binding MarR family transcriptional regulator
VAQLSAIFAKASDALGLSVLTPEYEIVLALVDCPYLTTDQLFERSSLSRAGFFNTVERLKTWSILISNSGLSDRRYRIYQLSGDLRQIVFSRFRKYRSDHADFRKGFLNERAFITKDLAARRDKGLDYFSCEFKILLYLYLSPGLANSALRSLLDSSVTKFHASLRTLLAKQQVCAVADAGDKRRKRYDVSACTRSTIDALHSDLFIWLDRNEAAHFCPTAPPQSKEFARSGSSDLR